MEANQQRARWTWSEFARLPSEGGTRYEVIDDELIVTPAPSLAHQRVVTRLGFLLHGFVREHGLGEVFAAPVDIVFGEGDYLEPDIVFVDAGKASLLGDRGIEGPPDLVVEVATPSTAARDRGVKLDRYRLFGVPEYWVVDADRGTVEVWALADGAGTPRVLEPGDTLEWTPGEGGPTLAIDVEDVLARPGPGA